jgi:hypothetical protein
MTDEAIRRAFEKWWLEVGEEAIPDNYRPTLAVVLRELAFMSYRAAMDRLEQVGNGLFDSDGKCHHVGQHRSSMRIGSKWFKSQPLYRIKDGD